MDKESKAVIDLCIQAPTVTKDVLKAALRDFLNNKTEKKGKIGFGNLFERHGGKLESIEVSDDNIGDFLKTAAKYDIDFSLKKDKSTEPPTYHVFFGTRDTNNFKRAFTEYAVGVQNKVQPEQANITVQQLNDAVPIADEANRQLNNWQRQTKIAHQLLG